jgi:hypothetical protein
MHRPRVTPVREVEEAWWVQVGWSEVCERILDLHSKLINMRMYIFFFDVYERPAWALSLNFSMKDDA